MKLELGQGTIQKRNGDIVYNGTLPFDNKDKVFVIKQSDLESLIKNGLKLLNENKEPMEENFFKLFPDSFRLKYHGKDSPKLYLDRHYYSPDYTDVVFIRYVSMNQVMKEHDLTERHPLNHYLVDPIEDEVVMRDRINKDTYRQKPDKYYDGEKEYDIDDDFGGSI